MSGATPLVTIGMPTYERTDFLRAAIDSALAQTFEEFELLVSDNSTSDRVESVVREYDDPRISYHRNVTGGGLIGNWRRLAQLASTDVLVSLHDDDRLLPDFLDRVARPLVDDTEAVASVCDYWIIDAEGARDLRHTEFIREHTGRRTLATGRLDRPADIAREALVGRSFPTAYACALRPSLLLEHELPEEVGGAIDLWLAYLIARTHRPVHYCADRQMEYRMHGSQLSQRGSTGHGVIACTERFLADPEMAPLRDGIERRADEDIMITFRALLDHAEFERAARAAAAGRPYARGSHRLVLEAARSKLVLRALAARRTRMQRQS